MSITVNTIYGTFIVPDNKQDELVAWLQANAVKPGHTAESIQQGEYAGKQLINE
jgi:hypothetical protein